MKKNIPLFRPVFTEEEAEAVRQVLLSGWVGLRPKTEEFEREFSKYIGTGYAIGVNSCTSALHLALVLADVGPEDEVIVPALTFVSTAHAIKYVGAKAVFCDIDRKQGDFNLDLRDVESKITHRTKAIIPVHFGGRCVDIPTLRNICRQNVWASQEITIIEDCAHACGAPFRNQKAGSFGDIGCFVPCSEKFGNGRRRPTHS